MKSLSDTIKIALGYAGLAEDFFGLAHKLVGMNDEQVGMSINKWLETASESEKEFLYAQTRYMTIKWAKMRSRTGDADEREETQSQPNTPATVASNSASSPTVNSVQSPLSSNTVQSEQAKNSGSRKKVNA